MMEYLIVFIAWVSIVSLLIAICLLIFLAVKWIAEVLKDDSVW